METIEEIMEEIELQATMEAMGEALVEGNQMATEDPMEIITEEHHQEAQFQHLEDPAMVLDKLHLSNNPTLLDMMGFLTKIMLILQVFMIHL